MKKIVIYYSTYILIAVLVFKFRYVPIIESESLLLLWQIIVVLFGPMNYMLISLAFPFFALFSLIHFTMIYGLIKISNKQGKIILAVFTIFLWLFLGWIVLQNIIYF